MLAQFVGDLAIGYVLIAADSDVVGAPGEGLGVVRLPKWYQAIIGPDRFWGPGGFGREWPALPWPVSAG